MARNTWNEQSMDNRASGSVTKASEAAAVAAAAVTTLLLIGADGAAERTRPSIVCPADGFIVYQSQPPPVWKCGCTPVLFLPLLFSTVCPL